MPHAKGLVPSEARREIRSCKVEVAGGCQLPKVGAGNKLGNNLKHS